MCAFAPTILFAQELQDLAYSPKGKFLVPISEG